MSRKQCLVVACALAFCLATAGIAPVLAQNDAAVSGLKALEYVKTLAGEAFDSRMAGMPGGAKAGAWIADQLMSWGLEPAGTNGYFQDFKKAVFHVDRASFFIETGAGRRTFVYGDEWQVAQYSGSAAVQGEIVFAGYGIASDKHNWNEFAGLDLKGKIVLMIPYGAPSFLASQIGLEAMPEPKIAKAYELGAKAVVMMNAPRDSASTYQRYPYPAGISLQAEKYKADMVVAGINDLAVKAMFRNSGIDLYTRIQKMEQSRKPGSQALGIQAEIVIETTYLPEASCRNILARITGSDSALRDEYVIVGAHYDGLGRNVDGRLNPGADDNASGTAAVMEIARTMKAGNAKPKRTVVFALWDGEEQGLWGSTYYIQNPVFPVGKTIANLNLDMVGNGDPQIQFRGTYYGPEIWQLLKSALPTEVLKDVTPARGGPSGSDHAPFLAGGVPGFFIQTAGSHYGRHNVGDKPDLVDPALLERSAIIARAGLDLIADSEALKPSPDSRAINILRSSTLVDLAQRDLAAVLKEAETVDYPDVDFVLVGLKGESPAAIAKDFYDTTAAVQASKKAQLYQPPASIISIPSFTDRFGILPGVADLAPFQGQDALLRLLGRAGLGYIVVRDADFGRGEDDLRRMIGAANAEGILVIAWETNGANGEKLLEWSTRPGLLVTASPDVEILKKMALKRWRLAYNWKTEMPPEEYAASFAQLKKDAGPVIILVQRSGAALSGFDPALIKLAGLLAPKEMNQALIQMGGMDEFGQALIQLLLELHPIAF
jgi:hypothetical protein